MERLSEAEKERIAELVAAGAPAWVMHREISRSRWAIRRYINRLQRPAKPEPKRSPLRLSLVEREEISRGLAGGESLRSIAGGWVGRRRRSRGRCAATVAARAIGRVGQIEMRCGGLVGRSQRSWRSANGSRAVVEAKLERRWSPQQISGWLARAFPDDPEMRVSHETIYLSLFVQSRGALRKELTALPAIGGTPLAGRSDTR